MTMAGNSFEDTATIHARVAPRGSGAALLAILSRMTEPHLLIPFGALLVLGFIWGTTLHLIRVEKDSARGAAIASARELLGTYEAQVVRALREIDQTLKFVQYAAAAKGDQPALADLQARSLLPPNLVFVVSLIDAHGTVIASSGENPPGSVSTQEYFATLRDKPSTASQGLSVDRPHRNPQSGDWSLQFSRRLDGPGGSFGGIVTVGVDAAYFASGYEISKLGRHGVLGVLGTDGIFRVRRTGDSVTAGDSVNYAGVVAPSAGEDDATVALAANPWDGVRRFTAVRELYEFPVAVIVGLSEEEQFSAWAEARRAYLQRAWLGSGLVIFLAGLLARLSWQLLQARRRESAAKIAYAERVEYLAYHDGLSGLPNRTLFSKLLTRGIKLAHRHQRRLAVLFLDLDRFKQINDTLGHEAGDQLLREAAVRLKSCLRDSDTVARLGGDEFVVLLPELESAEYAAVVAQKILTSLARPFLLAGQEFRVTASIGICSYPEDGEDEQTLTKHADVAMYQAKAESENSFQFYSDKLNANSLERLTLESSLRHAVERREFLLCYEPRRDPPDGRISGAQVRLRWQHPSLGSIAPMQFMRVAEETGIIVPIGKWALRSACLQNVAWHGQGLRDLCMAVSLTPRQFSDEHLLGDIAAVLDETGMAPRLLEFRISEGSLLRDVGKTGQIMARLRTLGVRIAIDDFGAGYASLSAARPMPFDGIHIDIDLIRGAPAAGAPTLANAIIAMGRSLSPALLAQGIDEPQRASELRERGAWQGYCGSDPLPAAEFARLLQSQLATDTVPG